MEEYQKIIQHLQREDAQKRIQGYIQHGRTETTVTIGRAASLFKFTENQLRDWEDRGLLKPLRPTGQRQYSFAELDKLAIIRELIDAKYAPGEIPPDIDKIWYSISNANGKHQILNTRETQVVSVREADNMPIDQRIRQVYYQEAFWRFYVSHALRLSLMLICEDITVKRAGLILPLRQQAIFASKPIPSTDDLCAPLIEKLSDVGESLIGWLGQSRSFYTFLTHEPSFEYPTDFHILQLKTTDENAPCDNTLVVLPREDARFLALSEPVVKIVRRLLAPLYNEVPDWNLYLGAGMRDILAPLIDFNSNTSLSDTILTGLAERVVQLGDGKWRFCCVLVPNNPQIPLQQRSLVVRAKSKGAPADYKLGTTLVSPEADVISVSLRAFQGARIINRHRVTDKDTSVANLEAEEPVGSAIAVPVGGEDGLPVAVLYIVSDEADAFSKADYRVLRMIGRMVEELLLTYRTRIQVAEKFTNLIKNPSVVDPSFGIFASENEFVSDVESLIADIQKKQLIPIDKTDFDTQYITEDALSFIAIDIDNQTRLTSKYGDRLTKNLSRVIGQHIQRQVSVLFTKPSDYKLYHVYADRFYLSLNGISLEEAREKAELLRQKLNGSYQIDALRSPTEAPSKSESMLVSVDITVRLGVSSYPYVKIQEILRRYPSETALASTVGLIARFLDGALKVGQDKGGNVIITWDPKIWGMSAMSVQKIG